MNNNNKTKRRNLFCIYILKGKKRKDEKSFSLLAFIGCIRTGQLGHHLNLGGGGGEEAFVDEGKENQYIVG